jgi:hypothetical protein
LRKIDLDLERQRLKKRYAEMNGEELEKIGSNPLTLTEWARDLLREEISKRGLEWREEQPASPEFKPPPEIPNDENVLVLLHKYESAGAAAADKQVLEGAGVDVFFFADDEPTSPGAWSWTEEKGVNLLVRAADRAASLELLPKKLDIPGADCSPETAASAKEQDSGKPVAIRSYRDLTEAMVDRSKLESAGITCFLYDDHLIRLDWFVSNAIGGVKLVVSQNEAAEALKILNDVSPV